MTPADLYRECRWSAWRVEALQHYTVPGDEERQRAFHAGKPLSPPGRGKAGDLALISDLRSVGTQVGRVHVVDRPLSAYVRYELAVYDENVAAGEDVRIADRSAYPELSAVDADFVIFDAGTPGAAVVLFDYDKAGLIRGYRIADDPETVRACRESLNLALSHAVPLAEFDAVAAAS